MFVFTLLGRGGQGVENTAKILGKAAVLSGFYTQSFVFKPLASRGDTIMAQVKIDKNYITSRQVEEPDFLLVFDKTLDTKDAFKSIKDSSVIIMNSKDKPKIKLKKKAKILYLNATDIALQHIGKNVLGSVMAGSVAKLFNKISLRSMKRVMEGEQDLLCLEQGFKSVRK